MVRESRPTYRLVLHALPSPIPPEIRLRHVLKRLLRDHGFRAIVVEPVPDDRDVGSGELPVDLVQQFQGAVSPAGQEKKWDTGQGARDGGTGTEEVAERQRVCSPHNDQGEVKIPLGLCGSGAESLARSRWPRGAG
jgi:hypothetical protein